MAHEIVQDFAPKIPDNLPRRAPFFGRDKEMGVALRALSPEDRTWGVLVDGIGGIGKSALAVEAAYRCKEKGLFDAFVFVSAKLSVLAPSGIRELTPVARTLEEFLNETARVLGQTGIAQLAGDGKRRALFDALRSMRVLLIYDNLETLTKEGQEAMAELLRELPQGCKAIITSRRRGGEGAVWLRLENLEWEAARAIIESEITRDSQLANKLRHAGEARWPELYDETHGSPLALMHVLGLIRVRATLTFDGALTMLRGHRDPDLQKFVFQEARRELTTNDQTALRALSFFVPSAAFEAWMEVAGLSRNALETTIDRLSALSLVDVLAGEERYALHPLTRNFVRDDLLADAQIAREIGKHFAGYWEAYARRYGGPGENYQTFNLIEVEWPNLDTAAEWLSQTADVQGEQIGDKDAAQRLNALASNLCNGTGPLFYIGRWDELVQLGARAYEAMRALNNGYETGWRAYQVAWVYSIYVRNMPEPASMWVDRCAEAWASAGGKHERANETRLRGWVAWQRKEYDVAERLCLESLAIHREMKSDVDVGRVLNDLGGIGYNRGDYDAAEQYYRESLALAEEANDKEVQSTILDNLSNLALARERWAEARDWAEKSLPLAREIGRQDLIATAHTRLAQVHEEEGRPDLALALAQEALVIRERLRDRDLEWTREFVERLREKVDKP